MNKTLSNIMKNLDVDYDTLYKMYFDRTTGFGPSLMMFPYMRTQNLVNDVTELKKKIRELEKKINGYSS